MSLNQTLILYNLSFLVETSIEMPALAPTVNAVLVERLARVGRRLKAHRKALRVGATTAAEAAGMSRATLHRIERGEPSVSMAAYMNAVSALGLELALVDPGEAARASPGAAVMRLSPILALADYAQLRQLAWQRPATAELLPREAFDLYERHWRHVDAAAMGAGERALVDALAHAFGGGRLLV